MRAFKVLFIFTILFSLLLMQQPLQAEEAKEENWMGIYSGGKRVGYSYSSIEKTSQNFESRKAEITEVKELTNLKINLLGKDTEVYTEGSYELDGYKILSFRYEMSSNTIKLKAWGRRDGNGLLITMETVSGRTERVVPIKEELILSSLVPKLIIEESLAPGDRIGIHLFEPLSILMGMDKSISTHRIEGEEAIETPLGKFDTFKVSSDFMGSKSVSWITKEGDVVRQISPPDLEVMKESKKDILSKKNSSFNVIQKTSIPANITIDDPADLNYLKVKLRGIDIEDFDINDGYRQRVEGQFVEIKPNKNYFSDVLYSLPYEFREYREFTEADFLIQSDDKDIVAITNKIVAGEKDPSKAARKINNWIYKNLKKSPTVSLPNAKDVLKTKIGDCNEHAALFSAMSRAAGIPTKTVLGIMYYKENFYYHAWNEVFLGEWVAVDSTYGQFPADATHVKLIEGNLAKSGEILKVVGKLNIEIIDAS